MINKQNVEKYLSSFSGDYKEIFFEKSRGFRISFLNGKFKTPVFSKLEGYSVLSRTGKNEYFKVFSGFENIEENIELFKNEFGLSSQNHQIKLNGFDNLSFDEINFDKIDLDEIFNITNELYETEIKTKDFITSVEISINLSNKSFVVGNTSNNFSKDSQFYNTYFIKLLGTRGEVKEEVYEKITGVDILEDFNFENIKNCLVKAIDVLDKQLDGIPSPNGKIDVIIGNEAGGTIIHEAVGHGLEADLQNSSVYKGKIGQKVASDNVTIVDNPTTVRERGFYKFDHEGNEAKNTILIENGILKSYLHNEKTAAKFGVNSTSHGRKETYKHKTLVRMGNTYLLPGNDKKEDLIERVTHGVYVSRMGGGQVNTTTGDFVFKVQNGFLIENGKLTKNITGATLSGNGPEMLNEIYGICDDLDFFDGGTCGKGQAMPVSDGTPTILTKLKVSGVN